MDIPYGRRIWAFLKLTTTDLPTIDPPTTYHLPTDHRPLTHQLMLKHNNHLFP